MAVSRARYVAGMRRFVDFVLIVLVLAVVGFGAYEIGHGSTTSRTPSRRRTRSSATTVAAGHTKAANRHRDEIIVGAALGGTAVLILLGSLTGSLVRSRKREHSWRAS